MLKLMLAAGIAVGVYFMSVGFIVTAHRFHWMENVQITDSK